MHFIIQSIITNKKDRPLEKNNEVIRNAIGQFVCRYVVLNKVQEVRNIMNLNNTIIGRPTQRPTYSRCFTTNFSIAFDTVIITYT